MKNFWLLLGVLLVQGCGFVRYLSVNERTNETANEYHTFLADCGVDTTHVFQIKPHAFDSLSYSVAHCLNLYKFEQGTAASPIQLRMYDKQGALVMGWAQCYGDLNGFRLFEEVPLRKVDHLPNNYAITLQNDLQLLALNEVEHTALDQYIRQHEYTLVAYFCAWGGWYAKDALKRANAYAKAHEQVGFVAVNTANYASSPAR